MYVAMIPMITDPRSVVVSIVLQVVVILECPFVSKIQVAKIFFVPSHICEIFVLSFGSHL